MAARQSGYVVPLSLADGTTVAQCAHARIANTLVSRDRSVTVSDEADQLFIADIIAASGAPTSHELAELRGLLGLGRARTARAAAA